MPPLTITEDEVVRMVDALDGALDEVHGRASRRPVTERHVGRPDPGRSSPGSSPTAAGGRPGRSTPLGPAGVLEGRRRGRVLRLQRLSRLERASGGGGRGARGPRRWGAGSGASRLVTGSRPIHSELEAALAEWKGTEAAVCFPTGFAANLGVLDRARRARRAGALGRAEPRQHHRRLPALPLGAHRVPPPGHGPPRRAALGRAAPTGAPPADDRRDRLGVLHGWGRGPARRAPRPDPPPRGPAGPR